MDAWKDREKIEKRIQQATALLLMLDFDGTLSPIASHPDKAILNPEMKNVLLQLAKKKHVFLAIVSGRQLINVKEKIGIPDIIYAGNHGLEKEIFGEKFLFSLSDKMAASLEALKTSLKQVISSYPHAWIEDKDIVVTIHYRQVPDVLIKKFEEDMTTVLEKYNGIFFVSKGKKNFEIKPTDAVHKGTVVVDLLKKIEEKIGAMPLAMYIGDDTTDEDAFAALPDGVTIRVGKSTQTLAKYTLSDTKDVYQFLVKLAEWTN